MIFEDVERAANEAAKAAKKPSEEEVPDVVAEGYSGQTGC